MVKLYAKLQSFLLSGTGQKVCCGWWWVGKPILVFSLGFNQAGEKNIKVSSRIFSLQHVSLIADNLDKCMINKKSYT